MEETGLSMIESMFMFCNNVMSYEFTWMGHTFTLWNILILVAVFGAIAAIINVMLDPYDD